MIMILNVLLSFGLGMCLGAYIITRQRRKGRKAGNKNKKYSFYMERLI